MYVPVSRVVTSTGWISSIDPHRHAGKGFQLRPLESEVDLAALDLRCLARSVGIADTRRTWPSGGPFSSARIAASHGRRRNPACDQPGISCRAS